MKRYLLLCAAGLCLANAVARADAPAPVAPPVVDLEVDASAASGAAVWEAIQKGKITPEDAWQQGVLDAATVQAGLTKGLAGGEDDKSQKLRVMLGGLLVQHAPEVVKDTSKLPRQVQRVIADYYAIIGDKRAAPLYEAVLTQTDRLREQGLVIVQLGDFWTQQGQPQKAQDAYERGRKALTGKDPYFAGEMVILAARAWAQNGDSDKARLLYAQVEKEGDKWMMGMATYDQASFMVNDKPAQARDLVLHELPTLPQSAARIGPLWALAQAQWKLEAWPEAEAALQQMLQACPKELASDSQAVIIEAAKKRLQTLQQWKTKTFVLPLHKLLVHPDEAGVFHATLYVHSFAPQAIEVRFINAGTKLKALTVKQQSRTDSGVLVSIYDLSYSPSHLDDSVEAQIEVKDKPEATQQIELRRTQ